MILGMALVLIPIVMIFIVALGVDAVEACTPGQASGPFGLLVLLMALLLIAISIRFMLVSAVASAETVGPLAILKRSWLLTAGNYWRLLGFIVLLLIAAIALIVAASIVGGILAASCELYHRAVFVERVDHRPDHGGGAGCVLGSRRSDDDADLHSGGGARRGSERAEHRRLRRAVQRQDAEQARVGKALDRALVGREIRRGDKRKAPRDDRACRCARGRALRPRARRGQRLRPAASGRGPGLTVPERGRRTIARIRPASRKSSSSMPDFAAGLRRRPRIARPRGSPMMAASFASSMISRENHSHFAPTCRKSAR